MNKNDTIYLVQKSKKQNDFVPSGTIHLLTEWGKTVCNKKVDDKWVIHEHTNLERAVTQTTCTNCAKIGKETLGQFLEDDRAHLAQ